MHPDIYFAGVAAGLTHIQGKDILHNDIKADNIALGDCLPTIEIPAAQFWPTIIDFGKACPSEMGKKMAMAHTGLQHQQLAVHLTCVVTD